MGHVRLATVLATLVVTTLSTHAAEPLRNRIDALLAADAAGPLPGRCTDDAFLRRVTLDLHGTIPTAAETRAFLADADPEKRAKLVDRLLADPRYARHMAVAFDVMLMERRADKHVKTPEWRAWLERAIAANRPWNELAADILAADGIGEDRPAAKFVLDRDAEPNLLTRDVGRMFLGIDVQCAQCHDHPLVDDYLQGDYYGLFAFVGRSTVFQPDKKKPAALAETAPVSVGFKSVFTDESGRTRPRLPGEPQIAEPYHPPGDEYATAPAKNVRSVPRFSRRARLAESIRTGENRYFRRNIANRTWAHLFGRGLVHPVDQHHSDNPASHPELLDLLAEEFAANGFDTQSFLRELVLTEAYQRAYAMPGDLATNVAAARERLPRLEAERATLATAAEATDAADGAARTKLDAARAALAPHEDALAKANEAVKAALKPLTEARAAVTAKQAELSKSQAAAKTVDEAATKAEEVAKALPKDAEVVKAAQVLRDRAGKATAAVQVATKAVEEATAKVAPLQAKYDETATAARTAAATLAAAHDPVALAEAEWVAARHAAEVAATKLNDTDATIERLRAIIAWDEAGRSIAPLVAERAVFEKNVATSRAAMAEPTGRVEVRRAELTKAEAAVVAAKKTLDAARARLQTHTAAVALLDESLAKLAQAKSKLATDEGLGKTTTTLGSQVSVVRERTKAVGDEVAGLAESMTTATNARDAATKAVAEAETLLAAARERVAEAERQLTEITTRIDAARGAVDSGREEIATTWTHRFALAAADPLTPEQFAHSLLVATGQFDRTRIGVAAEITKKSPLSEADAKDAAKVAARESEIDVATEAKLAGTVGTFVKLFAASPGQPQDEFFATVDQALFLANGNDVRAWLNPAGENLTGRLAKLEDPAALAEELYLSVLVRRPTAEETADVTAFLADHEDRAKAIREMAWALLTSIEFRFQH